MSKTKIINSIKTLLSIPIKLEQMKLDNGTIVEAEIFEPNAEIFIVNEDERIALPIGEYILEDGMVLIVSEEGIIAEIKEAEAPAEETVEEAAETPELEAEVATPKKIVKSISEEMFFAEIDKLRNEIAELKLSKEEPIKEVEEVVVELAEEVKPIVASPESNVDTKTMNLHSQKTGRSVQDTVWSKIANIK